MKCDKCGKEIRDPLNHCGDQCTRLQTKLTPTIPDQAHLFINGQLTKVEAIDYSKDSFLSVFDRFIKLQTSGVGIYAVAVKKHEKSPDCVFLSETFFQDGKRMVSRLWKTIPGQSDWENFISQIK